MKRYAILLILVTVIAFLASCALGMDTDLANDAPWPTPTSHVFFARGESTPETRPENGQASTAAMPTVSGYFIERELLATDKPATSQTTYQGAAPIIDQTTLVTTTVYGDRLNANWKIVRSQGMEVQRVQDADFAHSGRSALAITPTQDFGSLYLVVYQQTEEIYRRDEVLGISFWLSGGDDLIATDELAVTVLGSNAHPHWVADDSSVDFTGGYFSETRLYFLDINRSIPSNTWVEVVVWLDNLIYDPDYEYVTGFYIKNDEGYRNTFYVDDVTLLLSR